MGPHNTLTHVFPGCSQLPDGPSACLYSARVSAFLASSLASGLEGRLADKAKAVSNGDDYSGGGRSNQVKRCVSCVKLCLLFFATFEVSGSHAGNHVYHINSGKKIALLHTHRAGVHTPTWPQCIFPTFVGARAVAPVDASTARAALESCVGVVRLAHCPRHNLTAKWRT